MTTAAVFVALPPEYQAVLEQAQERYQIQITPLQELRGGQTGARLQLVSIRGAGRAGVEHAVLKLDRVNPKARAGEMDLHAQAVKLSPPEFTRKHIPAFPYEPVRAGDAAAIFYAVAGQSLQNYRSLAQYERAAQVETIFTAAARFLLYEWNAGAAFEQAVHPQSLFPRWLSYRLNPGGNIETFFHEALHIPSDTPGLAVQGRILPNPLRFAREQEAWGKMRPIDVLTGFQHGDLNTGNILVKFALDEKRLEGFYLIDFALFKAGMPLFYDLAYLTMSYLTAELARIPFPRWIDLVFGLAQQDRPDPAGVAVEAMGACGVIRAGRDVFDGWVRARHASLQDDLWAQYRLAAAAAGLNFCNKPGVSERERLAGLIYAAAHLGAVHARFGVAAPVEVRVVRLDGGEEAPISASAALPAAAPASPEARSAPPASNLPVETTPFIGREAEVAEAVRLLSGKNVRLLTLTGPGGTGKTRLALQVAAQAAGGFAGGVCFVPLADVRDPGLVLSTIAQQLGLRESGGQPLQESLRVYLQPRQMLLVIDNFEQVAAAAPHISGLLGAAAQLKVLATSRSALNLSGEQEYPVPPMQVPEDAGKTGPDEVERSEAVQLFVQRAQAALPSFRLTPANAGAVARLCRSLDGLPLAIELAAARVKLLPPEAMLERLGNRLQFLTGGARDLPERQQTLRGAIDWSYHLLDENQKALFARLAIFVGGWSLEAISAVCNPDGILGDDLAGLEALMNSSLVQRVESSAGEPRFRMLESIRAYALEKLEERGEMAPTAALHARYFAEQCQKIGPRIYSSEAQRWLGWSATEHDNLRAALAWSLAPGGEIRVAVTIVNLINWFWYRRGHLTEGREWCRRILAKLNRSQPSRELTLMLMSASLLATWQGDLDYGVQNIKDAILYSEVMEDEQTLPLSLLGQGVLLLNRGQAAEARTNLERGLEIFREIPFPFFISNSLIHLGNAALALGDIPGARAYLEQAMPLAQAVGEDWLVASVLNNLGEVARVEGDYPQAQGYYEQSVALFGSGGDIEDQNRLFHNLGYIAMYRGDLPQAAQHLRKSLTTFRELGNRRGIAECLAGFARLAALKGQPGAAATLLAAATTLLHAAHADWWPSDQAEYRRSLEMIQSALEPAAFDAAWAAGREMDWDQALAFQAELSAGW